MYLKKARDAIAGEQDHEPFICLLQGLGAHLSYATVVRPGNHRRFHVTHHIGNHFFYSICVADDILAVKLERLAQLLAQTVPILGTQTAIESFLQNIYSLNGHNLRGDYPATTYLVNFYHSLTLDRPLSLALQESDIRTTRYRNHLIFSSKQPITRRKKSIIRKQLTGHGFTLRHQRHPGCDQWHRPVNFFNCGLDQEGRLVPSRQYLRHLRGLLHRARTRGDIPPSIVKTQFGLLLKIDRQRSFSLNGQARKLLTAYNTWLYNHPSP